MNCTITGCPGIYEHREVVHTMRQDDHLIVVDHVPAEVCNICGDVLFTPDTVRRLEALRHTETAPIGQVPLYDFNPPLSA